MLSHVRKVGLFKIVAQLCVRVKPQSLMTVVSLESHVTQTDLSHPERAYSIQRRILRNAMYLRWDCLREEGSYLSSRARKDLKSFLTLP